MPNHVHLIAVPKSEDSLRRAIGEAHRRYTRRVNFREGWRGDFDKEAKEIRRHQRTGRPLGNRKFIVDLKKVLGGNFQYQKPGPKSKNKA
jgi:REP element-mobilizing transposase RayT